MPNLLGKIPWLQRLLGRGMNADIRPDQVEDGLHRDALNFRMGSVTGNSNSLEGIDGEVVLYPPEPNEVTLDASYVCIGMVTAGNDTVSFHASNATGLYPRMKVNGITMALSPVIPYRADLPLQIRVLDREQGAIVFPVDGDSPALFWDIEAIKAAYAAGEQTYFGLLNIQSISVLPAGPTEWPQHTGNPSIGVGARPGQYVFWLRYYDKDGNRSNPGPPTQFIAVPVYQAPIYPAGTQQYPGGQTAGGDPTAAGVVTPYGVALKWQVDNRYDNAGWELIVSKFSDGQGLNGPGETEVVARRDMIPGEFSDVEFVYPRDNNFSEIVPADEAQQQFVNFTAPKAVEVIDNRVIYANITLKDEVVQLTFQDNGGNKTFPFTSRVFSRYNNQDYNDGFSDPVNNTYMKSAAHDERYSVGFMLWDGNASRSAVIAIADNVQMPERGRRKDGDSLRYSTDQILRTNTECQGPDPVSPTFDAIVQGTTGKEDTQYTNVINGLNYNPWHPIGPAATNFSRYKQKPIIARFTSASAGVQDTGFVFGPQTHSLGLGIYGPSNLEQEAPWCEVMSVMRTAPANRVIASGMAVYSQPNADQDPNYKSSNVLRAFFPDIESGVVPAAVRDDIAANPQRYRVKFTPYGFYNETYSYKAAPIITDPSTFHGDNLDMITYMDMQNDTGSGTITSVNNGEPAGGMAIQPGTSAPPSRTNNIGWQAWRRLTGDIPAASAGNELRFMDTNNTAQGAVELGLVSFGRVPEGRGYNYVFETDYGVYRGSDLFAGAQFDDQNTRRYHGPVWVVEILLADALVPTLNVQQYLHTGTHIATDRTIGIYQPDSTGFMAIEMFHARPFDAVPRTSADIRYAYVREQGQPDRRWMHAASNTGGATIATIIADINTNGFWIDPDGNEVYGLYGSQTIANGSNPIWSLRFGIITGLQPPPTGSRIVVKYDKREPILTHGFDCTIAPSVWAVLDRTNDAPYPSTVPMPYRGGVKAVNYILPRSPTVSGQQFELGLYNISRSVRQWVVMGTLVTRTPQYLISGGGDDIRTSFPRTHYIIRPTVPVSSVNGAANGFSATYDTDYPNEAGYFVQGGFRFVSLYNLDYSKQPNVTGVGIPLNGQNPRTKLPTGHIASFAYNPLSQDSPGLRTFTFDNLFIVDEAMGEVKLIAAIDQGGRQALWGWTQKGYYNIPYNAQMIVDADNNVIATQSVSTFWPRRENWIARDSHGMDDEFWRMAVKANVPMGSQNVDTVVWVDRNSVYMLVGAVASDIAVNKIRSVLLPTLSTTPGDGRPGYSAVYNRKNEEVWITMLANPASTGSGESRPEPTMYVFDMARKQWAGVFSYQHEQYTSLNDRVLASTGLTIYEVNTGDSIDGEPIERYFTVPFFMQFHLRKEAMRWRLVGDMPPNWESNPDYGPYLPSAIEVLDAEGNVLSRMEGSQYALWAKNYDGFEGWVNRVLGTINTNRPLPQSQGFYLRVYYNTFGRKVADSVGMQLKTIK